MPNRVVSFHISAEDYAILEKHANGKSKSQVVKTAVAVYRNPPTPEHYLEHSPEGPWTKRVNVSYGNWMAEVPEIVAGLNTNISALVRYCLHLMLESLEQEG